MDKNMLNDEQLNEVSGGTKIPYVVVAGDTLTAIAQKNNVSLTDLMRWNNIQDPNLIRVGQQRRHRRGCAGHTGDLRRGDRGRDRRGDGGGRGRDR